MKMTSQKLSKSTPNLSHTYVQITLYLWVIYLSAYVHRNKKTCQHEIHRNGEVNLLLKGNLKRLHPWSQSGVRTGLAPEKLSFRTFLQDLSRSYFENRIMQERGSAQTTKRTKNYWTGELPSPLLTIFCSFHPTRVFRSRFFRRGFLVSQWLLCEFWLLFPVFLWGEHPLIYSHILLDIFAL
jgi:hypothetical protein